METKQAHAAARAMVKTLRAFEMVEEVLNRATMVQQAQGGAEGRLQVLNASADKWEAKVTKAQAQYAAEKKAAEDAVEAVREQHEIVLEEMTAAAERAVIETNAAVNKALSEGQARIKALTTECRALETQRDKLEQEMDNVREAHTAMLRKLGVKDG